MSKVAAFILKTLLKLILLPEYFLQILKFYKQHQIVQNVSYIGHARAKCLVIGFFRVRLDKEPLKFLVVRFQALDKR